MGALTAWGFGLVLAMVPAMLSAMVLAMVLEVVSAIVLAMVSAIVPAVSAIVPAPAMAASFSVVVLALPGANANMADFGPQCIIRRSCL
jgi:hypothetical protein